MAHTIKDKKKLINRVRRVRGQLDAVEKALEREADCSQILLSIATCRGAINSLTAEVIEGHVRAHIVEPNLNPKSKKAKAVQEVVNVVKSYLK